MNNLKVWLCMLSLLCLVCLLAPSTILAQEDGEPPCCYGPPPNLSSRGISIDTQNPIILLDVLIEISLSQPASGTATDATATIASNKPTPMMLPKDGFQAINMRRANHLMV